MKKKGGGGESVIRLFETQLCSYDGCEQGWIKAQAM
jgi:hypothetical protein